MRARRRPGRGTAAQARFAAAGPVRPLPRRLELRLAVSDARRALSCIISRVFGWQRWNCGSRLKRMKQKMNQSTAGLSSGTAPQPASHGLGGRRRRRCHFAPAGSSGVLQRRPALVFQALSLGRVPATHHPRVSVDQGMQCARRTAKIGRSRSTHHTAVHSRFKAAVGVRGCCTVQTPQRAGPCHGGTRMGPSPKRRAVGSFPTRSTLSRPSATKGLARCPVFQS
jgi:hypothetical protein